MDLLSTMEYTLDEIERLVPSESIQWILFGNTVKGMRNEGS